MSAFLPDDLPLLEPAGEGDIPAVVAMMNRAYRGAGSDDGWSSEAGLIEGDRITEAQLRHDIAATPAASLLVWRASAGGLIGCVWLQPEAGERWYLGSLTISPLVQDQGLGRRLLFAAEQWAVARGGKVIRITVVNLRMPLIAWYERRGYLRTGELEPFPYGDDRFGRPTRDDLCFLVLAKPLGAAEGNGSRRIAAPA